MSSLPTKKLYNEWEMISSVEGNELLEEITNAVKPIIDKYAEMGFSLREIEYLIINTISVIVSERILLRNMKVYRDNNPRWRLK
jgi:hypothetical protein